MALPRSNTIAVIQHHLCLSLSHPSPSFSCSLPYFRPLSPDHHPPRPRLQPRCPGPPFDFARTPLTLSTQRSTSGRYTGGDALPPLLPRALRLAVNAPFARVAPSHPGTPAPRHRAKARGAAQGTLRSSATPAPCKGTCLGPRDAAFQRLLSRCAPSSAGASVAERRNAATPAEPGAEAVASVARQRPAASQAGDKAPRIIIPAARRVRRWAVGRHYAPPPPDRQRRFRGWALPRSPCPAHVSSFRILSLLAHTQHN